MMDIREMDIALRAYETKTEMDHTKFIVFSGHLDSCAHDKVIQGLIFQLQGSDGS